MPRKLRVETSDGLYHVINRGNYRNWIYDTDGAKRSFRDTLFEACERFSWELSAYCLMSNHYHLCLGTPCGNLSDGMRWLGSTFAARFNRYRKEQGHLFQGRFKSLMVEPGTHWRDLVDYIHLNPVRAGLADTAALGKYPWTSLQLFPKRKTRPSFLDCRWMAYSDDLSDTPGGWRRYANVLAGRNSADPKEVEKLDRQMCRGWCIGADSFRKAVAKDFMEKEGAARLEKEELRDLNETRWAAGLEACMKALKKTDKDAERDPFSVNWKLAIARKLKSETSVTNAWLGKNLNMGKARSVSAICGRYAKSAMAKCAAYKKLANLRFE